jgi:hypothetical protein
MEGEMVKIAALLCVVLVVSLVACGGESETVEVTVEVTATPMPPTSTPIPLTATSVPTPCDEVDGTCLYLYFDGEGCAYEGPTDLKPGPVTLLFLNESEETAAVNMMRLDENKTIQDYIDRAGEEPSWKHAPAWVTHMDGVWRDGGFSIGQSYTSWEGVLESGIHVMVCGGMKPLALWIGGVLTVED